MEKLPKHWINQPHVIKYELYIGHCEDEKVPYSPNYTNIAVPECYTLQYVPSGRGEITIDGKHFFAKEGDLIAILPHERIIERADSKDPWHFIWFYFLGDSAPKFMTIAGLADDNRVLRGCQNTRIPIIMREMAQAAHDINNPLRLPLLSSKCFDLFNEIAHVNATRGKTHQPPNMRDDYTQRAAYFLTSNYRDKDLSVEAVARSIGLNRSYLYKVFKETTGISPQAYLMQLRINKACELLILPENTVTSVAYAVGYEPLSFTRAFKNVMGMTPLEYRKKNMIES